MWKQVGHACATGISAHFLWEMLCWSRGRLCLLYKTFHTQISWTGYSVMEDQAVWKAVCAEHSDRWSLLTADTEYEKHCATDAPETMFQRADGLHFNGVTCLNQLLIWSYVQRFRIKLMNRCYMLQVKIHLNVGRFYQIVGIVQECAFVLVVAFSWNGEQKQ